MWWYSIGWTIAALVVGWVVLLVVVFACRPDDVSLPDLLRLLPDTVRLVRRLAGDKSLPTGTRVAVWILLAYLVSPIDLIPDFVPVVGSVDDVVLTAIVLRRLFRSAGADKLVEHWPGTTVGLDQLRHLLRIPDVEGRPDA